jgi:CRISPR type I-E-associated protein CasB/Cse2
MREHRADARREAKDLLQYLRKFKDDRGAMADLRSVLSPAKRARAWPLLAPVGGIGDETKETVAGLFAYHPEEAGDGNFGATCRHLAKSAESFDARFRRILACGDRTEVYGRLRGVVLAARAKSVPVNYEQLFADLRWWGPWVKARWAQEYWGQAENQEAEKSEELKA